MMNLRFEKFGIGEACVRFIGQVFRHARRGPMKRRAFFPMVIMLKGLYISAMKRDERPEARTNPRDPFPMMGIPLSLSLS